MSRPQDQYSSIYYSTLIASIGGFLVGYSAVIIASVMLFLDEYYKLNPSQQEILISIAFGFAVIGSLISGLCCFAIGRKKTIIVGGFIFIIAACFTLINDTFWLLLVSRSILGIGMGMMMTAVPFYISEIVPTNIRGSCLCVLIIEFYLGYFVAFLVCRTIIFVFGWKIALSSAIIPALGLFIGMKSMPESPFWLHAKGKYEQALESLKRLRRVLDIEYEIGVMEDTSQTNTDKQSKLFGKGLLKAIFLGSMIAILIEATGTHAIYYYMPSILNTAGMWTKKAAIDAALWVGGVSFFSALISMLFIDRLGRRRLLIIGTSITTMSLILLGIFFKTLIYNPHLHGIIILLFCTYATGFVLGLGSVGWLIIVEIYPMKLRSLLISSVFAIKWAMAFIITRYFLTELLFFGSGNTFWFYAATSFLGFIFVYFFVPETKNKSLQDIEEFWLKDIPHGREINKK